jgi:hypothetical protein
VINSLNNFFASKKTGLAMALLASVVALSSLLSFLPSGLRHVFDGLSIVFFILLVGFTRAYSDDWTRHKPWGKEFLTKAYLVAFGSFMLISILVALRNLIPLLLH